MLAGIELQTRVIRIDPKRIKLLPLNARFMRHETFARLVQNVKRDGVLTQIPFAVPTHEEEQPWLVISGNHRVQAAVAAELPEIDLQVTDQDLTDEQIKAIQLAHNAIVGEDDPATLKAIYEQIPSLELKEYCGLDDKTLAMLSKVTTEPNPSASLDWTTINFTFLPDEAERVKTTLDQAAAVVKKGAHVVARFADYDRFMDAVSTCGQAHGVTNSATSLLVLIEMFERHVADLRVGFLNEDGEPKHNKRVPVVAAMGTVEIPVQTASLLSKVLACAEDAAPFASLDEALQLFLRSRK